VFEENVTLLNSRGLTKIQSIILIVIIVVAAIGGGLIYILWGENGQSVETIKIGVLADLDNVRGSGAWQGAVLAAEQVNAEGGVLGLEFEIVAEDDDGETFPLNPETATNALTKLITVDKADYILDCGQIVLPHQDIIYEHKKILFSVFTMDESLTERVQDDYNKYKYYFRGSVGNQSTALLGNIDSLLTLSNYTGFNKIAFLWYDNPVIRELHSKLSDALLDYNFEIIYSNFFPLDTADFSSYLSVIEASGAEIFFPFTPFGLALVNEWYHRQTPAVIWGFIGQAQEINFWELSEGRCESVSFMGYPVTAGYPLTSKTLATREAYLERWGEVPTLYAAATYDIVRFVLPDALKRAGTTEAEAVIEAFEAIDVETSTASHFVYTSSHDLMFGENVNDPEGDYLVVCSFQWQDGNMVPVSPQKIKEEAGATYIFPPWDGPWNNIS